MEGRRCSVAALLFLTLALAATAVAQFHLPAGQRYMLVDMQTSGGNQRLAVKIGDASIPGFANWSHHWFAVTGSESLVPGVGNSYRRDIPGQGLGDLLRVLVNNGTRR